MIDTLVAGSIALDSIETPYGKVDRALGGSASYASLAASHFCRVGLLSIVGDDFPDKYRRLFLKHKIDIEGLHKGQKTFAWQGKYDGNMSQALTLKTELNALAKFDPKLPADYRKAKFVFLANLDPAVQSKIIAQLKKPKFIVMDTMNYWIDKHFTQLKKAIRQVDLLVLNDAEAKAIIKTDNLIDAGRKILKLGPRYVIIKKGEHGALLFSVSSHFSAPAFPLASCLDPTGAGDSFGGGLIGYLAKTKSTTEANIRRGIIYGSVVASYCAQAFSIKNVEKLNKHKIVDIDSRNLERSFFHHLIKTVNACRRFL